MTISKVIDLPKESVNFLATEFSRKGGFLLLNFFAAIFAAVLELLGLGLVLPIIWLLVYPAAIETAPLITGLVEVTGLNGERQVTLFLILSVIALVMLKSAYMYAFNAWQARHFAEWKTELSRRMMKLYVNCSYRIYLEKGPSEVVRNLTLSTIAFDQYIKSILNLIVYGIIGFSITVLLFLLMPTQALISALLLITTTALVHRLTKGKLLKASDESNAIFQQRQLCINQAIGAITETKVLGKEEFFLDQFAYLERQGFGRRALQEKISVIPNIAIEVVIVTCLLGIIGHLVLFVGTKEEALIVLGLLCAAIFRLLPLIIRSISCLQLLAMGKPSLNSMVSEINQLDTNDNVQDKFDPKPMSDWNKLELRDVSFTYPDGCVALRDVNIQVFKGEKVCFLGKSGSGKTTIMMLLLGLLEPTKGQILIDGQPLSDPSVKKGWQATIGFVPQGLFIISGSIAENIAFGEDDYDEAAVTSALITAQLEDFVNDRGGLNFDVGELGQKLSGGQKQRLAIARALYRRPAILAFDEATSSVDQLTENALIRDVVKENKVSTILSITHKVALARNFDKVVMLLNGSVSGVGTYETVASESDQFVKLAQA